MTYNSNSYPKVNYTCAVALMQAAMSTNQKLVLRITAILQGPAMGG